MMHIRRSIDINKDRALVWNQLANLNYSFRTMYVSDPKESCTVSLDGPGPQKGSVIVVALNKLAPNRWLIEDLRPPELLCCSMTQKMAFLEFKAKFAMELSVPSPGATHVDFDLSMGLPLLPRFVWPVIQVFTPMRSIFRDRMDRLLNETKTALNG